METVTITFGDQAENHVGMQKLGSLAEDGFTVAELREIKEELESKGCECELVNLVDYLGNEDIGDGIEAGVLIIRRGVDFILSELSVPGFPVTSDDLLKEQMELEWDSKAKMYGRVVDKHARHNLCYADYDQEPDYASGKGRIVSFSSIPYLSAIRSSLSDYFGDKAKDLMAEGNLYYDTSKCGIGAHGDSERRRVIALRLGDSMPLHYRWFIGGSPVGEVAEFTLNHGDLYVMSEKAVGTDWKRKNVYTLRHAAGCAKYLKQLE